MVVGSRFLDSDVDWHIPWTRRVGITFFRWGVSLLIGESATDTTSGFCGMNRPAIHVLATYLPQDYPDVESRVIIHKAGLRQIELPVNMQARTAGISSINAWKSIYYAFKVSVGMVTSAMKEIAPYHVVPLGGSGHRCRARWTRRRSRERLARRWGSLGRQRVRRVVLTRIPIEQQILAIVFSIVLLLVTVQLVRKRKLREEYALVWLGAAATIFLLVVFDGLVTGLAAAFGVSYAPTLDTGLRPSLCHRGDPVAERHDLVAGGPHPRPGTELRSAGAANAADGDDATAYRQAAARQARG